MNDGRGESLKDMQNRISGYHVYDQHYERVGKVNDLFIDENDELEYIGLDLGGLLKSRTALIPMELVRINDRRDLIEIQADKNEIEASPSFGSDDELTHDYENKVQSHFGLTGSTKQPHRDSLPTRDEREHVDTEYGERAGHPPDSMTGESPASPEPRSPTSDTSIPEYPVPIENEIGQETSQSETGRGDDTRESPRSPRVHKRGPRGFAISD